MLAGHTDTSGSAQYNLGLAERRNNAVRNYMTGRGVPAGQISSEALGETRPRVPTADGVREAQNRRGGGGEGDGQMGPLRPAGNRSPDRKVSRLLGRDHLVANEMQTDQPRPLMILEVAADGIADHRP